MRALSKTIIFLLSHTTRYKCSLSEEVIYLNRRENKNLIKKSDFKSKIYPKLLLFYEKKRKVDQTKDATYYQNDY